MKVARLIALVLLAVLMVTAPILALPRVFGVYRPDSVKESDSKSVLTLWHIETFEGGSTSRARYLERVGKILEKKQAGLFIWVRTMDVETLNNQLKEGSRPDIISFGSGLGNTLKPFLLPVYDDYGIDETYLSSCGFLAMPYLVGGYVLIGDDEYLKQAKIAAESPLRDNLNIELTLKGKTVNPLLIGKTPYISPQNAILRFSGAEKHDSSFSQYDAYESFILKKSIMLLGTVRDVNRIIRREDLGKIRMLRYDYLDTYTDLVQYLGLVTTDMHKQKAAKLFFETVFSKDGQSFVKDTGMMSVTGKTHYQNSPLAEMESVLRNIKKVQPLFS